MLCTFRWVAAVGVAVGVALSAALPARGAPAAAEADFVVGRMRVQTMGGFTFFHVGKQAPRAKALETLGELSRKRGEATAQAKVQTYGPGVVIYRPGGTPDQVLIEVGGMVAEGAQPAGEAEVRKLEPFRCAALAYCGPYASLAKGYQALAQEVKKAELKETGEYREFYLYWESDDSPNNVFLLQAGIRDAGGAANPAFAVSPLHVQTLRGFEYFHASAETTAEKLTGTTGALWPKVWDGAKEAKAYLVGPEVMIYLGAGVQGKPYTLQAGKMVAAGTRGAGAAKVRKVEPLRCATTVYLGGLKDLRAAVARASKEVEAKGLKRVREYREYYLYWEGADSPNNVLLLQYGIQD